MAKVDPFNSTNEADYRGLRIHAAQSLHSECMSVINTINLPANAKVLDLGAGEGAFSQRLLDAGFEVTAADIHCEQFHVNTDFESLDLNKDFYNHWKGKFDLVIAIEIIEHLHNPRHFISNCLNSLHTGGILLLTSPNTECWLSRIRFLRDGHLLWFEETDYQSYGHLTPIFSWQVSRICVELGAEVIQVSNTKNKLLLHRVGEGLREILRNKSIYLGALYPLMRGRRAGEINIYLIRKTAPDFEQFSLNNSETQLR